MPTFRVNAIPVAQPRQRHRIVNGAKGMFASNYTPKNDPVNAFKAHVQIAAEQAGVTPTTQAVSLGLTFYFPRPKGHLRKDGLLRSTAPLYKTSRPDFDNLAKSVCDALNGIAWKDDSQIVSVRVEKKYADSVALPGVLIRILTQF